MPRIIDLLDDNAKTKLYRFTKLLIEDKKDFTIEQAMKQDSYRRINRRIRQVGWKDY
ncbi:hypothetical protein R9X47_18080 [Wukongibacter baidiensis]|uniref:hypothetical protein n=1 Tax=Wukongibacter baidiensis TaxID=1723361 RepID=UPI003D7FF077